MGDDAQKKRGKNDDTQTAVYLRCDLQPITNGPLFARASISQQFRVLALVLVPQIAYLELLLMYKLATFKLHALVQKRIFDLI